MNGEWGKWGIGGIFRQILGMSDKYLSKFICIFFAEVLNNYFGV
jgi:hypothetical protein